MIQFHSSEPSSMIRSIKSSRLSHFPCILLAAYSQVLLLWLQYVHSYWPFSCWPFSVVDTCFLYRLFKKSYWFIFRESEWEREREQACMSKGRGRRRESLSRLPAECGAQCKAQSQDPEILTWTKINSGLLNQLLNYWGSHPGAPYTDFNATCCTQKYWKENGLWILSLPIISHVTSTKWNFKH